MSRHEILELEKELKGLDDLDSLQPDDHFVKGENGELVNMHPEFLELKRQVKMLVPIRLGIIKRYFDKYKLQKKKREEILAACAESEA